MPKGWGGGGLEGAPAWVGGSKVWDLPPLLYLWLGWVGLQSRTPPLLIIMAWVGGHRAIFEKTFTLQFVRGP